MYGKKKRCKEEIKTKIEKENESDFGVSKHQRQNKKKTGFTSLL